MWIELLRSLMLVGVPVLAFTAIAGAIYAPDLVLGPPLLVKYSLLALGAAFLVYGILFSQLEIIGPIFIILGGVMLLEPVIAYSVCVAQDISDL